MKSTRPDLFWIKCAKKIPKEIQLRIPLANISILLRVRTDITRFAAFFINLPRSNRNMRKTFMRSSLTKTKNL